MAKLLYSMSMSPDGIIAGGRTVALERVRLSGVPVASILRFRVPAAG